MSMLTSACGCARVSRCVCMSVWLCVCVVVWLCGCVLSTTQAATAPPAPLSAARNTVLRFFDAFSQRWLCPITSLPMHEVMSGCPLP